MTNVEIDCLLSFKMSIEEKLGDSRVCGLCGLRVSLRASVRVEWSRWRALYYFERFTVHLLMMYVILLRRIRSPE